MSPLLRLLKLSFASLIFGTSALAQFGMPALPAIQQGRPAALKGAAQVYLRQVDAAVQAYLSDGRSLADLDSCASLSDYGVPALPNAVDPSYGCRIIPDSQGGYGLAALSAGGTYITLYQGQIGESPSAPDANPASW